MNIATSRKKRGNQAAFQPVSPKKTWGQRWARQLGVTPDYSGFDTRWLHQLNSL